MGCSHNNCELDKEETEHNHFNEKRESIDKKELILYIISIIIFALSFLPFIPGIIKIVMYVASILLAGYELLISGIKNLFHFNFEEDTLMAIAIIAACAIGEFTEGCLVVLLFKLGEFIENRAISKSNENISDIVKIKSKNANLILNDSDLQEATDEIKVVDVEELQIGDKILIKPGEMVPVDCIILKGASELDTSNITGESKPVTVVENKNILSGTINLTGSLICEVTKSFKDSTASQIVDLVYEATNNKGKTEKFITKFSKIYTPTVIIIALIMAIVPPILGLDFKTWLTRALVFLVASCPCSIVISIPLAFFACIGAIARKGMIVKGTTHIEDLAKAKIIAFDKTGTITTGKMEIDSIVKLSNYSEKEMLSYMYILERNSNHPISTAIRKKINTDKIKLESMEISDYKEIAGYGISARVNDKSVLFGNKKLLKDYILDEKSKENVKERLSSLPDGGIFLSIDGDIAGYITLQEELREGVSYLVEKLKNIGINKTVILTGDNKENAEKISEAVKVSNIYSGLLPKDKLKKVEELKKEGKVIFVGDGINDSPVLASADFSIAMGEGTEIAGNAADSILISNNINSIVDIIKLSRKTIKIAKFNITFSLLLKLVVLILGVLGIAPIWLAVFADVGVTLITVINSIRIN